MDASDILLLISRWTHILFAVTLVGGTIFMRLALVPALQQTSADTDSLLKALRARWSKLVMASSLMLILSGVYNLVVILGPSQLPGYYHGLFGAKLLLAIGIFLVASVLAGRSENAKRFQQKESFWLTVNVVLAIVLICLAGTMKQAKREPKSLDVPGETDVRLLDQTHGGRNVAWREPS